MVVRLTMVALVLAGLYLQYKYWFSDVGYFRSQALAEEVDRQRGRLDAMVERNRILAAEVQAQKQGHAAVEARARSDLGMVKEGESFFLVTTEPR